MQTKDRERVNKKTGKVTIVRGSTPIKEGVVVTGEDGDHKAVGDWLVQVAATAEGLDSNEICRAQKEVNSEA